MSGAENAAPRLIWRLRLLAASIALMALAFSQEPGNIVPDTKFDLVADPGGFLARSLSLWDPSGAFGQLQNQAYGYLFPMGPFFWLGDAVGLQPWIVQRLWWSLVLIVAFLGMWRLSAALVQATPWARLAGSLLYALAPKILSELTAISIEVWPMALAPWVLWPLVDPAPRSWRWRITRSAVAVACLGGVNAVASGAALVLPALWFLTRRPSLRVYGLALIWLVAVTAAIAWWLGALLLLGQHSPPFLDWIESISITSSTASVFEAVRGTSAWLGFLVTSGGPSWPGGFLLVSEPALVVVTAGLAALGLVGLGIRSRVREPLFLSVAVVVGLFLLTAGHEGAVRSVLSSPLRDLLDGPLAAMRNLHKFDLVVRVPLTLGVVVGIDALTRLATRARLLPSLVPIGVVLMVVSVAAPAVVGTLARPESYERVPAHWYDAAAWLDAQPGDGAVLMLPAASVSDFEWGSTKDNPLQALATRPFVHRDAVPLGSAGATRFLDGLQAEVGSGRGGVHIPQLLSTAGVRFVLVPNDLRLDAAGDDLVRVHSALEQSGLRRVAAFGQSASSRPESEDVTVDFRTVLDRPRIEIFEIPAVAGATVVPLDDVQTAVSTGPEDLVALTRMTGDSLAVLADADAAPQTGGPVVAMDGLRSREVAFGRVTHNRSHVLQEAEPPTQDRPVVEYTLPELSDRTLQGWDGVARLTASSSASDVTADLYLGPGYGPAAAIDGVPESGWMSGEVRKARGQWLRIDFTQPVRLGKVWVEVLDHPAIGSSPSRLEFESDTGVVSADVLPNGLAGATIPDGLTSSLTITLTAVTEGFPENAFGIGEIQFLDRWTRPRLEVPAVGRPDTLLLERGMSGTPPCVRVDGVARCNPEVARPPEEPGALRRTVRLEEGGRFAVRGWAVPSQVDALDGYVDHPGGIQARSSSRLVPGPWLRPGAAFDTDEGTGWIAARDDPQPRLSLLLPEERQISGLRFVNDNALAASRPRQVSIAFGDGTEVSGTVGEDGLMTFEPRDTRRLTVSFGAGYPLENISSRGGMRTTAPVGASEIRVLGAEDLSKAVSPAQETGAQCGFGPSVTVNGIQHETTVSGSIEDLLAGTPLEWELCSAELVMLRSGPNVIDLTSTFEFMPDSIAFERQGANQSVAVPQPAGIDRPSAAEVTINLPDSEDRGERVVIVPQNFHDGWLARDTSGTVLEPIKVNGWMQAWRVPAATSEIEAHFAPDRFYRPILGAGGLALLALLLAAWWPSGSGGVRERPMLPGRPPEWFSAATLVVAGVLIGGLPLGLCAVLGVAGAWWLRSVRAGAPVVGGIVLVLLLSAAALVSLDPWPAGQANIDSLMVQALTFTAVVLGVSRALHGPHAPQLRPSAFDDAPSS